MKQFIKSLRFFISLIVALTGCKKIIEIAPPKSQLVTTSVFENATTATAAQTAIYSQMEYSDQALPYCIPLYAGLSSDELTNYSSIPAFIEFYGNSLNARDNTYVQALWAGMYNLIYQANAIIEGLQTSSSIKGAVKQQLIGEAKFTRAFLNLNLTNFWGDVPLVAATNYEVNSTLTRSSKSNVLAQVISDLKQAAVALNSEYVDGSDTSVSADRVRPTKWAATSLLARAYLYSGAFDSAEAQATDVIENSSMFSLEADLNNVFLANSKEAIWQLLPNSSTGYNTVEAANFFLNDAPSSGVVNCTTLSNTLLSAFEQGDNRRKSWIDSSTDGVKYYYYPFKYKVTQSSSITEYSMVLRLAEQYLIRAEARAQQDNLTGAAGDLNIIRNRAGLPNTTATTKSDFLAAILHERQTEFFSEWGHRWFDIVRTGTVNSIMGSPQNVCVQKGGTWSSDWQLYPIPQVERENNPQLTQNSGY